MRRSAILATVAVLALAGCGSSNGGAGSEGSEASEGSETSEGTAEIPENWKKYEAKDAFTDAVTKYYIVESNESSSYYFSVACANDKSLNFYVEYPAREGTPSMEAEVNVRIDSALPFTKKWYVSWVSGATRVEDPVEFFEQTKGKSKLAIEIFAATRSSYDITGIDRVVADMEATACKFEPETTLPEAAASENAAPAPVQL
jgi:hypothetical protein